MPGLVSTRTCAVLPHVARWAAVGLFGGLIFSMGCGPPRFMVDWVDRRNPEVLFSVETADSVVALTIDDAPSQKWTPRILEVLDAYDARATFFLMGRRIPGNEPLVRRIVADGHELGHHMMTATPSILLSSTSFESRMQQTARRLAPFGGAQWLRPASGWFNRRMVRQAEAKGYRVALGSIYSNDSMNPFTAYHVHYILSHVRPGDVIILHDGLGWRTRAPEVLSRVLPELQDRGYRIVTLSELVAHGR